MKKYKKLFSILILLMLSFVIVAGTVSAQPLVGGAECNCDNSYSDGDNCYEYCTGNYELNDFFRVLVYWVERILGLIGSLALIMFVYGGFTLLISAGNQERVTKGRTIMMNALIGIVIVFTSYMIIGFALEAVGYGNFKTWNVISG